MGPSVRRLSDGGKPYLAIRHSVRLIANDTHSLISTLYVHRNTMKAATISQLKKELVKLDHDDLLGVCIRMARFKVESKELLTYLLLKADDEIGYANELCQEIDELLSVPGRIHKKTLRKVVRWMDKTLRFSGNKETELQVRIHFCQRIKDKRISFGNCRVSENMYATQFKKINKAIDKVHPDLQFDYKHQMSGL